jgi:diguanylate cyclase (GGDEF)-like protein
MQGWSVDVPVNFAGQNWTLSVLPTKPALIRRQSTLPQQLLLACLLLVILNQAFLLVVTGKEQLERREAQISHYLASRDPLTDLLNRRAFMAALEQARSEADVGPVTHALLVFDLDHFKPINDTAGHEAGDHALKQLSQCVGAVLRRDDVLARLGGDEFAVILRNCTPGDVPGIAAKLLAAIKNLEINFGGQRFVVTASLGIRCLDRRAGPLPSSSDLLRDADQACYQAKDRGRDHWVMVADAHPHL